MGRTRTFDDTVVIARCAHAFRTTGYEGTSIDDLVQATGLHRGSLYKAFGSKRGLFVAALRQSAAPDTPPEDATDLLLVALMELANRDDGIRSLVVEIMAQHPAHTALSLGERLLDRSTATNDATKGTSA